jgi:type I restriction enzyme, S subunit
MGGLKKYLKYKNSGLSFIKDVPEHWEVRRTRWFFKEIDQRSEAGDEELLSVSHITGVTRRSDKNITMFMAESYEGFKLCQPDDLVINIMWAWMGALGVSRHTGIVSSAYGVYRQRKEKKFIPEYLDHLVRLPELIAEYHRCSKGIRPSRLRMYSDDFFQLFLFCPPLDEQRSIVQFINQKLAQIDQFICYKRRLIELLNEQKRAIIDRAVTKGCDRGVAMKASGNKWFKDIPMHWKISKAKRVASVFVPQRNKPELNFEVGIPWITMEDIATSTIYQSSSGYFVSEADAIKAGSRILPSGSVIASCIGSFGAASVNTVPIIINQQLQAYIPKSINVEYLRFVIYGSKSYFEEIATETTVSYVNQQGFANLPVPVPPESEQQKIVDFINRASIQVNQAIAQAEKEIELIQEYRAKLISDAITGKIDVRGTIEIEAMAISGG